MARCRVRLDVTVFTGRRRDDDNLIASLKNCRDGLCTNALTPNDGPDWVRQGSIKQVVGPAFRLKPSVLITATEEPNSSSWR